MRFEKIVYTLLQFLFWNVAFDLIVSDLGVRPVGYEAGERFVKVPEMIPELIVPDLTGFKVV